MKPSVVINTDDLGICREVDDAVEALIDSGIVRSVSLLANGGSRNNAFRLLKQNPHVAVGVHLNAVESIALTGRSALTDPDGSMIGRSRLLVRFLRDPARVIADLRREWSFQIAELQAHGIVPVRLDSHQHLHAFPPFWKVASDLCEEFGIGQMRWPVESRLPRTRPIGGLLLGASARLARRSRRSVLLNDDFIGFGHAGKFDEKTLSSAMSRLRPGVTELAIHPSTVDHVPYKNFYGGQEFETFRRMRPETFESEFGVSLSDWNDVAKDHV